MSVRNVLIGLMLLTALAVTPRTWAGIYNTTDNPKVEVRWSQDYERVFREVLSDLRTIALPKPPRQPAIWKRYALMEALGRKGSADLKTLEQQLDYSAVLIRRDKAGEAYQLLQPLTAEHETNFVVWSQYAVANFFVTDFRSNAPDAMRKALELWPKQWADVKEEDKRFLEAMGWEETAFHRNRRFEEHLDRLMRHRVREEAKVKRKQKIEEMLDPIFVDDQKKPVRFLTEAGEFEAGRIALTEQPKLPDDAVEIVEQLLIWMPHDQRLLWLLGEVFNARAMKLQNKEDKYNMIRNAHVIFSELNNPLSRPSYGRAEIQQRFEILDAYTKANPDPRLKEFKFDDLPPDVEVTSQQWQRAMVVGFITGFAVGMFALWQIQEMRRRRQARSQTSRSA